MIMLQCQRLKRKIFIGGMDLIETKQIDKKKKLKTDERRKNKT